MRRSVLGISILLLLLDVDKSMIFAKGLEIEELLGFPFNSDPSLPKGDDVTKTLKMPFGIPFKCKLFNYIEISTNGFVTLKETPTQYPLPWSVDQLPITPPSPWSAILAPFWADADSTYYGNVYYRQVATTAVMENARPNSLENGISDLLLLQNIEKFVAEFGTSGVSFSVTYALIVVWSAVGFKGQNNEQLVNSFHMVYATNGSEAAVIYSYPGGGIEWVVGDVDGGSGGFGGERAAVVGYDIGNGRDFYMVPESSKDNISTIDSEISSNVGLIGQWIFDIGNSHCVNVTNNYIEKLRSLVFTSVKELSLTPNYGNQLGGQSVSVEILNDDDINLLAFNITCTFDNIEASVYPISSTTILAIMPSLNRAGYIPINVQFQEGPIIWSFTEDFYSVPFLEASDFEMVTEEGGLLIKQGQSIQLLWNKEILPSVLWDPSSYDITVEIWTFDSTLGKLTDEHVLWYSYGNSGMVNTSVDLGSKSDIFPIVFQIHPNLNPNLNLNSRIWSGIAYYTSLDDFRLSDQCAQWSIGEHIKNSAPYCPKEESDILLANSQYVLHKMVTAGTYKDQYIAYFYPGASNCYHSRMFTPEGYMKVCCYDNTGKLLASRNHDGSGRIIRYPPGGPFTESLTSYFLEDVLPYIFCCKTRHCDNFFLLRPPDYGEAYDSKALLQENTLGAVYGDPHIMTFDHLFYTVNLKGEVYLVETEDESFTLQGRFEQILSAPATVMTALVVKSEGSPKVEFYSLNNTLEVLVESTCYMIMVNVTLEYKCMVNLNRELADERAWENLRVIGDGTRTKVIFPNGAIIDVRESHGFLAVVLLFVPESLKGRTRGLMGTHSDTTIDDLLPRYENKSVSVGASAETIFSTFAKTWFVRSEDSLFSYVLTNQKWSDFYDSSFYPVLRANLNPKTKELATSLCGDLPECIFDYIVTRPSLLDYNTTTSVQESLQLWQVTRSFNSELRQYGVSRSCASLCQNGGLCQDNYTCVCITGYSGAYCESTVEVSTEPSAGPTTAMEISVVVIAVPVAVGILIMIVFIIVLVAAMWRCQLHRSSNKGEEHNSVTHIDKDLVFTEASEFQPSPADTCREGIEELDIGTVTVDEETL